MNLVKIVYRVHVIYFCFLFHWVKSWYLTQWILLTLENYIFKLLRITTVSSNSLQPTRLVPSWSFLRSPMLFFYCCYRKSAWSQALTTIQIWTSRGVQWLRVHLPVQGTWTRALVWEYPTCQGATPFLHHSQCAHVRRPRKPAHPRAMRPRKGSHRHEPPAPRNPWGAPARRS